MLRRILAKPSQLTAVVSYFSLDPIRGRYSPLAYPSSFVHPQPSFSHLTFRCFSDSAAPGQPPLSHGSELSRVSTLVIGCDYEHWLVVMDAPKGYPLRDEIVDGFVKTLARVLGSEDEAKKSMYSVSTKYYYAFSCKVPTDLACKIKCSPLLLTNHFLSHFDVALFIKPVFIAVLPNVRWVLPDSYLCHGENGYGGEPFVNGEVVPYDEKYHADWLRDQNGDKCMNKTRSRKARRKKKEL